MGFNAVQRYNTDGSADTSFGVGGTAAISGMTSFAVAIQSDGKIIAGGYSSTGLAGAMTRFNTDGSLDSSFGSGGLVSTTAIAYFNGVALQADGKIVAAGVAYYTSGSNTTFAVGRFNTDGSPDLSFGASGVTVTRFNARPRSEPFAMAIQSDHKIVLAGMASASKIIDVALARYLP